MALGSTQPLTEMNSLPGTFPARLRRPVRTTVNLMTTVRICWLKLQNRHMVEYFCLRHHTLAAVTFPILTRRLWPNLSRLTPSRLKTVLATTYDATSGDVCCESASQEIRHLLRNSKFLRPVSNSWPPTHVHSQINSWPLTLVHSQINSWPLTPVYSQINSWPLTHVHNQLNRWPLTNVHSQTNSWTLTPVHSQINSWPLTHVHNQLNRWPLTHVHSQTNSWPLTPVHSQINSWPLTHVHN